MNVFLLLLLIVGIVLIVLDIRNIVKWKKEKKRKAIKADPELAANVIKALSDIDSSEIMENYKKAIDGVADSCLVHKEDKKK